MIDPDVRVKIRHYFFAEHWRIGTIAAELQVHPDTVRRAIEVEKFQNAAPLLEDLHRQTPEGRLRKLRTYANVSLMCIDEAGYLSFDDKSADLLYEVINRRYEKNSVIVTTNKPFKQWNEVFPNAACIATMLDRLLHHAEVTVIEGSSYRVRESEQESTARRR